LAAGCDLQEDADLERGRDLFVQQCGVCHALTEARTAAVIGPSLDSSFAEARSNGMDQDTVEGVVQAQIENPRQVSEDDPDYDNIYMPADLVTGRDAEDVAAYVASVAGVPGIEPPELGDGEQIFTDICGGCHQLEAANTAGGVGPSLDEVLPDQMEEMIATSIRDPQDEISPGFDDPSIMPVYDENTIPPEDLEELVTYLVEEVGGAAAAGGSSGAGGASGGSSGGGGSGGGSGGGGGGGSSGSSAGG